MSKRLLLGGLAALILAGIGYAVYVAFFSPKSQPLADRPEYIPSGPPPTTSEVSVLAETDAVKLLDACLARYLEQARGGFRATLIKHEWVDGTLHPEEEIRLAVRGEFKDTGELPKVRMIWLRGARKVLGFDVRGALFVEGERKNNLVAWRPGAIISEKEVAINDGAARANSRYCIRDAGLYAGMLRTYTVWKACQEAGTLRVEFLGKRRVAEVGDRECYVIRRICPTPELDPFELGKAADTNPTLIDRDGFNEVTIYIDTERLLQVGTVIRRTDVSPPRLIGEYYFRNVELNPAFSPDTFTMAGMKAAKSE